MENNTSKEKWIDEVLNSTDGMKRAQPNVDLYEQITAKISRPQPVTISFPVKRWVAAAILLLALNVSSVLYFNGKEKRLASVTTGNPLASQIEVETTYNY